MHVPLIENKHFTHISTYYSSHKGIFFPVLDVSYSDSGGDDTQELAVV